MLKTGAEPAILQQCRPLFAIIGLQVTFCGGWQGEDGMKTLTIAAVMLALFAVPAHAQGMGKRSPDERKGPEIKKPVIDDKAYKAALERIPEPKQKYDPWGVARPADTDKKPK